MRYLETVEEATIEQIYRNVPWSYYCNQNKHMGAMLATMVRRGLIERVKKGVFRIKKTRWQQSEEAAIGYGLFE